MKKIFVIFLGLFLLVVSNANAVLVNAVEFQDFSSQRGYGWTNPGIIPVGSLSKAYLDDGTSFSRVSSPNARVFMPYLRQEVSGSKITYFFDSPISIYGPSTIFLGEMRGSWSEDGTKQYVTKFKLGLDTPFFLEAEIGSRIASSYGLAEVLESDPSFSSFENVFTNSNVGDIVPYEFEYNIDSQFFYDVWNESTFTKENYAFNYSISGKIDFFTESEVDAVPEPATMLLLGGGLLGSVWRKRKKV